MAPLENLARLDEVVLRLVRGWEVRDDLAIPLLHSPPPQGKQRFDQKLQGRGGVGSD